MTWLSQFSLFILISFLASVQGKLDFGFSLFSLLVLGLCLRLNEIGINEYFVINGGRDKVFCFFIANVVKGFVFALGVFVVAFTFFEGDEKLVVFVLAFCLIVDGFKNPNIYVDYKNGNQLPLVIVERGSYLISIVISLILINIGMEKWIICFLYVMYSLNQFFISYFVSNRGFDIKVIDTKFMLGITRYVFSIIIFMLLAYVLRQGPEFYVKEEFGLVNLGLFSYTSMLSLLLLNLLAYPLGKFLFPYIVDSMKEGDGRVYKITNLFMTIISLSAFVLYLIIPVGVEIFKIESFEYELFNILFICGLTRVLMSYLYLYFKVRGLQRNINIFLIVELSILLFLSMLKPIQNIIDLSYIVMYAQVLSVGLLISLDRASFMLLYTSFTKYKNTEIPDIK